MILKKKRCRSTVIWFNIKARTISYQSKFFINKYMIHTVSFGQLVKETWPFCQMYTNPGEQVDCCQLVNHPWHLFMFTTLHPMAFWSKSCLAIYLPSEQIMLHKIVFLLKNSWKLKENSFNFFFIVLLNILFLFIVIWTLLIWTKCFLLLLIYKAFSYFSTLAGSPRDKNIV